MLYGLRTNYALAALGLAPGAINPTLKRTAITLGKARAHSPQEVALMLLSSMPREITMYAKEITAMDWATNRKIDLDNEDVRNVLMDLGWTEVMMLNYT